MKIKSVSGLVYLVSDLDRSIEFYKKLGFIFRKEVPGVSATAYLNWFWIELLLKDKVVTKEFKEDVDTQPKGAGGYTHISVDNTDDVYESLKEMGIKVGEPPQDFPWGRRELTISDPDGYKLTFFTKK